MNAELAVPILRKLIMDAAWMNWTHGGDLTSFTVEERVLLRQLMEEAGDSLCELGTGPMKNVKFAVSFEQFDEACRVDWEWRNRSEHNTAESWLAPDMAGVRERVHERMRNTLSLLGIVAADADGWVHEPNASPHR